MATRYDDTDRAQRDIAQRLWAVLPDQGWRQARLFWSAAGPAWATWLLLLRDDGTVAPLPVPADVVAPCPDLKLTMSDPHRGAWLLLVLTLDAGGAAAFDFGWDERVYWHDECALAPTVAPASGPYLPDDALWRAELAAWPRRVVPPWLLPPWPAPGGGD